MFDDPREVLRRAFEASVAYRQGVDAMPVRPGVSYPDMLARVRGPVPETGAAPEAVIDELVRISEGGLIGMTNPRFFGWVIGGCHPAGLAADWLVSAWHQNTAFDSPTPAVSALEEIAEQWLLDLLDLPRQSRIGFVTGATVANAVGLSAARTRVLLDAGWDPDADGLFGAPPVSVLLGADAHSSIFSSLQLMGFGHRRVITVESDEVGAMQPHALEEALLGLDGPKIVIAQAGQINTGAYDPMVDIIPIAKRAGAWVHVDGAFGLWARATPKYRHLTEGMEGADSWVTDGHKWLQTPYDIGFAIVRDVEALNRAMTQWSSYLPSFNQGDRIPSALVPELSRRARGVPVWAVLKALGRDGVAEIVERLCAHATRFARRLAAEPGVHVLAEPIINQLIVSFGDGSPDQRRRLTEQVIAAIRAEGTLYAGGAEWRGDWVLRLSVTGGGTTEADIDRAVDAIIEAWRQIRDR